jgi:hypothetical protein
MVNHRGNARKGFEGEQLARSLFYPYAKLFKHEVTSGGCDLVGFTLDEREVAAEVLNWDHRNHFIIMDDRWSSIKNNLIEYPAQVKILVCFGVKPTPTQLKEARNLGISILHYPERLEPNYDATSLNKIKTTLAPQIEAILFPKKEMNSFIKKILSDPNSVPKVKKSK